MFRLGPVGIKRLKWLHIALACCWIGGAVLLTASNLGRTGALDVGLHYSMNLRASLVSAFILVPGMIGCLLTGIAFGLWTDRGFLSEFWLRLKWVGTLATMLMVVLLLLPWNADLLELSNHGDLGYLTDPEYRQISHLGLELGEVQIFILVALICVAIDKPGRKKAPSHACFHRPSWDLLRDENGISKQELLLREVDEVLYYIWDPQGDYKEEYSRDEYASYVQPVYELLIAGGDEKAITALLDEFSTYHMRMGPRSSATDAAKALLGLKKRINRLL